MGSGGFQATGYVEDGAEAATWASDFSSAVPMASKGWCLEWIASGTHCIVQGTWLNIL